MWHCIVLQPNIGYVEELPSISQLFCSLHMFFMNTCHIIIQVWIKDYIVFQEFPVLHTTIVHCMKFYFQPSKLHYQVIFLHKIFTAFPCFRSTFHFFITMLLIYLCYKEQMWFSRSDVLMLYSPCFTYTCKLPFPKDRRQCNTLHVCSFNQYIF
jgi:hypothetical protein